MWRHRLSRLVCLTQICGTILQRGVAVTELPLMQVNNRHDEFRSEDVQARQPRYCCTMTLFTSHLMSTTSQLQKMKTNLGKIRVFEHKIEYEFRQFPSFLTFYELAAVDMKRIIHPNGSVWLHCNPLFETSLIFQTMCVKKCLLGLM